MTSNNDVKEILLLLEQGFRPYNNQPEKFVYENLQCRQYLKNPPAWFYKDDIFLCISCSRKCSLNRPQGFQAPLPIKYPHAKIGEFRSTPKELVEKKATLNMKEVCYCLNVSYSKAYNWLQEGKLIALTQKPIRIRSAEVKKMMEDFDE